MELLSSASIKETLEQAMAQKKDVEFYLCGGQNFRGQVSGVSDHSVIVSRLAGKEYYDAQVKLQDISAISLKVREK